MKMWIRAVAVAAGLAGCAMVQAGEEPVTMRWDHRPEAAEWTMATRGALAGHGAALVDLVPDDIETWCPAYEASDRGARELVWTGLFSALAKHESTWDPRASGGGGRWIGLLQIAPPTARHYGCLARDAEALKDGAANLSCGVRIAAVTVARDGMVGTGRAGLAADWAPFLSERKRADMVAWTRAQPYCRK
jgi:hypothetical protein